VCESLPPFPHPSWPHCRHNNTTSNRHGRDTAMLRRTIKTRQRDDPADNSAPVTSSLSNNLNSILRMLVIAALTLGITRYGTLRPLGPMLLQTIMCYVTATTEFSFPSRTVMDGLPQTCARNVLQNARLTVTLKCLLWASEVQSRGNQLILFARRY
jgi:hypothetical protein